MGDISNNKDGPSETFIKYRKYKIKVFFMYRVIELVDRSRADQVILKHLYIETTVQKDFAQNSIFWKISFRPKIQYLRN